MLGRSKIHSTLKQIHFEWKFWFLAKREASKELVRCKYSLPLACQLPPESENEIIFNNWYIISYSFYYYLRVFLRLLIFRCSILNWNCFNKNIFYTWEIFIIKYFEYLEFIHTHTFNNVPVTFSKIVGLFKQFLLLTLLLCPQWSISNTYE